MEPERLNLRGVKCPYNFVKTKIKLEDMAAGALLEVLLDPGEPVENVPRSCRDHGHEVLAVEPVDGGSMFRVLIRKGAEA